MLFVVTRWNVYMYVYIYIYIYVWFCPFLSSREIRKQDIKYTTGFMGQKSRNPHIIRWRLNHILIFFHCFLWLNACTMNRREQDYIHLHLWTLLYTDTQTPCPLFFSSEEQRFSSGTLLSRCIWLSIRPSYPFLLTELNIDINDYFPWNSVWAYQTASWFN
jgi:hypothetical protein